MQMFGSESPKSKENGYNEKVDIWAVGVVTYELLFGQAPFFHEDEKETARLIQEGTLPGFMGFWSAECQDFLHQALLSPSFALCSHVALIYIEMSLLCIFYPM